MTKTKKNGLLLTLTAFMLTMISAALLFTIAPKRTTKADGGTPDFSTWHVVEFQEGYNLNETFLIVTARLAENLPYTSNQGDKTNKYFFIAPGGVAIVIDNNEASQIQNATVEDFRAKFNSEIPEEELNNVFYIPTILNDSNGGQYPGLETDLSDFVSLGSIDGLYILTQQAAPNGSSEDPEDPAEPEQPDNPGETPTNEPTETNTNEKNPFNLGEWLTQASDDVSAWLGDNVGIATTGSTVLVVGAIIIIIFIARRRR